LVNLVASKITIEVMDQTQNETGAVSFTCQATGKPVPIISWYFNGVPVNEANTMKYRITPRVFTNAIENTLLIMSVESSDVGTYTCNATNVVSSDTNYGVLTVNGELQICYYKAIVLVFYSYTFSLKNFYSKL